MSFWQRYAQLFTQRWLALSRPRQIALGVLTACCLALLAGTVYWILQPEYGLLYAGLSPEDAGAITAKLQAQSISYRLKNGNSIYMPVENIPQAKIDLAMEGLPSGGSQSAGMLEPSMMTSPSMQQDYYRRALQAELAKTIMHLEPIALARVQIARAEPTPFIREQKPTTASVMLKLKPGVTLSPRTINGIVYLVSRSVEGLTPDQVAVIDANGRPLTDARGSDLDGAFSTQMDHRRELETYLATKAEDILARFLGQGHAVVRVSAEIDFKRVSETIETFRAEDKVASEELSITKNSTTPAAPARGPAGTTPNLSRQAPGTNNAVSTKTQDEQVKTTYAIPKRVQKLEDLASKVERLTVAAMVELPKGEAGAGQTLTLAEAQDLIKQAVGFKKDRDEIKVSDVKMAATDVGTSLDSDWLQVQRWQGYVSMTRNVSLGVAAMVVLALGWLILRRFRPVAEPKSGTESAGDDQERQRRLDEIATVAKQNPEAVARVLTTWLDGFETPSKAAA